MCKFIKIWFVLQPLRNQELFCLKAKLALGGHIEPICDKAEEITACKLLKMWQYPPFDIDMFLWGLAK